MNVADALILIVIAISALLSLRRGFVREAFSLFTWIAAFVIARIFSPSLDNFLIPYIELPSARLATAFGSLFAATLIIGALINHLLAELVRMTGLSSTDRLFGVLFGAVRGVLVVVVMIALGRMAFAEDAWWQQSTLVPWFAQLEDWTREAGASASALIINFGSD